MVAQAPAAAFPLTDRPHLCPEAGGRQPVTLRVLQEEHREARLTLRPPSLAAPYAPVQSWQHRPEKLIFESCGYEANVSACPPPPPVHPHSPHSPRLGLGAPQTPPASGGASSHTGRESLGEAVTLVVMWALLSPARSLHSTWAPC